MGRRDNYPDDIRCYDNDPRSPFYDDGPEEDLEEAIEKLTEEIADDWQRMDEAAGDFDDLRDKLMMACHELYSSMPNSLSREDGVIMFLHAWKELANAAARKDIENENKK